MRPDDVPARQAGRKAWADVLAWAGYAAAVLAVLWPLGLTNRVLAGVDAFTYFTPYWSYRIAQLSAGHIPLWNPYLFLGVPFLANPQAAVLYPPNWLLNWLPPAAALVWSALLHVWLAAGFTYVYARRSLLLRRPAAWLVGLLFGMGGFALARIENINQLSTLAWLPMLLWLLDEAARTQVGRARLRWGAALSVSMAVQLLAGHTQTAFVNLTGLAIYASLPALRWVVQRLAQIAGRHRAAREPSLGPSLPEAGGRAATQLLIVGAAVIPALLLAGAQLLPTLELNRLGLRTGGLPFRQAVSFSLRPRLLALSLLPPYGGELAGAFEGEGYGEYLGYTGIAGLALGILGVLALLRKRRGPGRDSGWGLALLCLAGLLLALGAYNPVYYLLWRVVPGFSAFRAPARWLELYAFGMAGLAGMGLDALLRGALKRAPASSPAEATGSRTEPAKASRRRTAILLAPILLAALALAAWQQVPRWQMRAGWLVAGLVVVLLLWVSQFRPRAAVALLVAASLAELAIAGRSLPFALATAPGAFGMRNAPAALLAAVAGQPPAGRDRLLSLSDNRFDPGDLDELQQLQEGSLPPEAIDRLVRASKQMEIVAPNLALLLRLPAIDGYDGGAFPTSAYLKLMELFLPPELRLPDGRLREQLRQVPPDRLLDLTGVRFIVTDKQNDLWAGDVYYDLEQPVELQPGQSLHLDLTSYPAFSATRAGVVSSLQQAAGFAGHVARLELSNGEGSTITSDIDAPADTEWAQASTSTAEIARPWPESMGRQGHDYLASLDFGRPFTPAEATLSVASTAPGPWVVSGLSLIDSRTGAHESITLSQRGDLRRIHSGDVKIYSRAQSPGRAWLVHGIDPVTGDVGAMSRLGEPSFDPRTTVVLPGPAEARPAKAAGPDESVVVLEYEPERVALRVQVTEPATLVLADAFYPGWRATVDGKPSPVLQANLMFRAISLDPGSHDVVFLYEPAAWRFGVLISAVGLGVLLVVVLATLLRRNRRDSPSAEIVYNVPA